VEQTEQKQPSSVEIVFEAQKQNAALEQDRKMAQLERVRNIASLGTAIVFSGTALYGILTHTMDTTVVCALIGAATTLFTGLTAPKRGKHDE
jgi:1-deoxy-D-xylulose 5-phosphate reductoisomerase